MSSTYTRKTFPWGRVLDIVTIPMETYVIEIIKYVSKSDNLTMYHINGSGESCMTLELAIIRSIEIANHGANSRLYALADALVSNIRVNEADIEDLKQNNVNYEPKELWYHYKIIDRKREKMFFHLSKIDKDARISFVVHGEPEPKFGKWVRGMNYAIGEDGNTYHNVIFESVKVVEG